MSELDKLIAKWREEWPLPNDCDYSYRIDAGARHNCADDLESRKAAIEREYRLDEARKIPHSSGCISTIWPYSSPCTCYRGRRIAELEAAPAWKEDGK